MLLKLILVCVQGVLSVIAAEGKHGAGAGPVKKREVMRTLEQQAVNLKLDAAGGACDFPTFLKILDDLVDDVVALLNCFGVLGAKK